MTMAWPMTKAATSEHSQTTAAAISSGLPIRPTGSSAITFARPSAVPPVKRPIIGVSMYPGADGVDADVPRGVVEGRRPGEADYAVLGGGIRGVALDADDPGTRGGVHDRPAALLEDQGDLILHAQEDAAEIDVEDPVPLLLVQFRGRCQFLLFDAGVVEGEVQPPEHLNGLFQGRPHVLGPRHVAPDGERPAALLLDHANRLLVARLGHIGDHHAGPLAGERQRRRAA